MKKISYNFSNKIVLITGATGILGRCFSESFAKQDASIVLVDIDQKLLDSLGQELLQKYGTQSLAIKCDISIIDDVSEMIKLALVHFGRVDVLINNAATKGSNLKEFFRPFEDFSLEVWQEIMSVNVDGVFLVTQAVGREMIRHKQGVIINISSVYGLIGNDQRIYKNSKYLGGPINTPAVYSTSKAAVIGLTRYLATYWGKNGIRVNAIAPGGIESGQNKEFMKRYSEKVPLGRMGHSDEIAATALFLASDSASYINGQIIVVDGGLTAW